MKQIDYANMRAIEKDIFKLNYICSVLLGISTYSSTLISAIQLTGHSRPSLI